MRDAAHRQGITGHVPRVTWLGIAAAVVLYLAAAVYSMVALSWKGTADAPGYLDYIYQVHLGRLPDPVGYPYREVVPRLFTKAAAEGPQWVSSHPPLFPAVASLWMGDRLEAGKWQSAVARGRLLNIFIGLCCVLALAWAGWRLGGARRALLAVALPAVAGCMPTFVRFSAEVYNDVPVTLCSIVAMTLACIILREGPSKRRVAALTLACMAGMATKATFAIVLGLATLALFVALLSRWWRSTPRWWATAKASLSAAGFAVAAVLPISWFYWRNLQLSGSWVRSQPKMAFSGRREKTLADVLADERYWLLVPRELLGKPRVFWPYASEISLALFFLCLAGVAFLAWRSGWARRFRAGDLSAVAWLLLAAQVAGIMLAQMEHAVGWGAYHIRYFLPAALPIGLLLVGPLCAWPRMARFGVPLLAALMAYSVVLWSTTYQAVLEYARPDQSDWARLLTVVEGNGLTPGWVPATIATMGFAVGVLAAAMWLAARTQAAPGGDRWRMARVDRQALQ